MDAEIKKLWVEALRSKKYQQTRSSLREGDCFCALGVLCDILDPEGWQFLEGDRSSYWVHGPEQLGNLSFLWPGLKVEEKSGISPAELSWVQRMNDIYGWSFDVIADEIEKHF